MDPNFAYAHAELRNIYRDLGKYDLAMEEWKKYAALDNDSEELAIAQDAAEVYAKSGDESSDRAGDRAKRETGQAPVRGSDVKSLTTMLFSAIKNKPLPGWTRLGRKKPEGWRRSRSFGRSISGTAIRAISHS